MYATRVQFVYDELQNDVIDLVFWEWKAKDQKGILSIRWIGNHTGDQEGWFTCGNQKAYTLRQKDGWYVIVPPTKEEIIIADYFLSKVEKEKEVDVKEFDLHWPPPEQCDTLLKIISEGDVINKYDVDIEYHDSYYDTYHEYE